MTSAITLTGSAQVAAEEDRSRKRVTMQNPSLTTTAYFNLQGTASVDTFFIAPGGSYETPDDVDVTGRISVSGTAGQKLIIMTS